MMYNLKNWFRELITGKSDRKYGHIPLLPKRLHLKASSQNFLDWGEAKIKEFEKFGLVNNSFRVLDIGCGSGRMAIPLTRYLSSEGSYEGLDIHRERIYWLNQNVSDKYPNFNFIYTDIYNGMYNQNGKISGSEYRLPFEDESFDFVFLLSVFTHMLPEDFENYLKEIYRVLKKSGKCWISYFLVNYKKLELMNQGNGLRGLNIDKGVYWVRDFGVEEQVVGYNQKYVKEKYGEIGFDNLQIKRGSWAGQEEEVGGGQDVIIAEKR